MRGKGRLSTKKRKCQLTLTTGNIVVAENNTAVGAHAGIENKSGLRHHCGISAIELSKANFDYLGPIDNFFNRSLTAGGQLKEAGTKYWNSPNHGANNSSGFAARPGGQRTETGSFIGDNGNAYFWRANSISGASAKEILIYSTLSWASISNSNINFKEGQSIRCIQD